MADKPSRGERAGVFQLEAQLQLFAQRNFSEVERGGQLAAARHRVADQGDGGGVGVGGGAGRAQGQPHRVQLARQSRVVELARGEEHVELGLARGDHLGVGHEAHLELGVGRRRVADGDRVAVEPLERDQGQRRRPQVADDELEADPLADQRGAEVVGGVAVDPLAPVGRVPDHAEIGVALADVGALRAVAAGGEKKNRERERRARHAWGHDLSPLELPL